MNELPCEFTVLHATSLCSIHGGAWDSGCKCLQWVWIFPMGHKHCLAWRLAKSFCSSVQLALHNNVKINLDTIISMFVILYGITVLFVYVPIIVGTVALRINGELVMQFGVC